MPNAAEGECLYGVLGPDNLVVAEHPADVELAIVHTPPVEHVVRFALGEDVGAQSHLRRTRE